MAALLLAEELEHADPWQPNRQRGGLLRAPPQPAQQGGHGDRGVKRDVREIIAQSSRPAWPWPPAGPRAASDPWPVKEIVVIADTSTAISA